MITDALAVLLALIIEQEKQKYKDELIPIRTVAIAGGAHSPEVSESSSDSEELDAFQTDAFQNDTFQ